MACHRDYVEWYIVVEEELFYHYVQVERPASVNKKVMSTLAFRETHVIRGMSALTDNFFRQQLHLVFVAEIYFDKLPYFLLQSTTQDETLKSVGIIVRLLFSISEMIIVFDGFVPGSCVDRFTRILVLVGYHRKTRQMEMALCRITMNYLSIIKCLKQKFAKFLRLGDIELNIPMTTRTTFMLDSRSGHILVISILSAIEFVNLRSYPFQNGYTIADYSNSPYVDGSQQVPCVEFWLQEKFETLQICSGDLVFHFSVKDIVQLQDHKTYFNDSNKEGISTMFRGLLPQQLLYRIQLAQDIIRRNHVRFRPLLLYRFDVAGPPPFGGVFSSGVGCMSSFTVCDCSNSTVGCPSLWLFSSIFCCVWGESFSFGTLELDTLTAFIHAGKTIKEINLHSCRSLLGRFCERVSKKRPLYTTDYADSRTQTNTTDDIVLLLIRRS
ncbi:uncharacterized protein LOC128248082 [Octopus bimaculoides]|uniref:uncharacterized protein LOC128248082 n=1 Tax=Octopus bimaculoides TaxID=37653 RepID=UPI0022E7DC71|nr:uncharacterized protein LOC128248082 [Octopus bimaculoides]